MEGALDRLAARDITARMSTPVGEEQRQRPTFSVSQPVAAALDLAMPNDRRGELRWPRL